MPAEFWGKKSQYTEGTDFLGTPKNHLDVSSRLSHRWRVLQGSMLLLLCQAL